MNQVLDPQVNKGKSPELTDGRPVNPPGIYKHRDTGAEFITAPGEEGVLQADAMMSPVWKDAWERIGDVPSRSELQKRRQAAVNKVEAEEKAKKAEKAKEEADEAESKAKPAPGTGVNY